MVKVFKVFNHLYTRKQIVIDKIMTDFVFIFTNFCMMAKNW